MNTETIPYWMAFAHAKGISNKRKMDFLIDVVHEKITMQEAMENIRKGDKCGFDFSEKEWEGIHSASQELANYSFLAEQVIEKGIKIFHVMDKHHYPANLKKNLRKDAPILIYAKGNVDLLKRRSVAIVGSRKSQDISLKFTENVAQRAVNENSVVVSGFAKGVDKKALDAALLFKGQSIIVLPQGIETYSSKVYYPQIIKGNVLIISSYHPKVPWSVSLAMDRNKIIYGLAEDIYAAESDKKGGTWEGVLDGLKRNRKVYVRLPGEKEKNANLVLIQKGASPVDFHGNEISGYVSPIHQQISSQKDTPQDDLQKDILKDTPQNNLQKKDILKETLKILEAKNGEGATTEQIAKKLLLEEKEAKKLSKILSNSDLIRKEKKGRYNYFFLINNLHPQGKLF